ncbi:MAG TPA: DinB family protein [Chryseosolibacter sp.]|nr:DinB family protein [Chryseosolibacter sp.]
MHKSIIKKLDKIKKTRLFTLHEVEALSIEQLNRIPDGFNNNIIWNLAHMVSAFEAICYLRAGLAVTIDDQYLTPYLTNTRPTSFIGEGQTNEIKRLLVSTVENFQVNAGKNLFNSYEPSANIFKQYNISLTSIDDAIEFLLFHDGYHAGCISVLKRFV